MGRKKRRKKIAKAKFRKSICSSCNLCTKSVNPKFCYNFLYKKNPGIFRDSILPAMLTQSDLLKQLKKMDPATLSISLPAMAVFANIFCSSKICTNNCKRDMPAITACLTKFKTQELKQSVFKMIRDTLPTNQKKKKNRRRKKIKQKPKVTVFMSDNEEFKAEVKKIIEDNRKQPDKD